MIIIRTTIKAKSPNEISLKGFPVDMSSTSYTWIVLLVTCSACVSSILWILTLLSISCRGHLSHILSTWITNDTQYHMCHWNKYWFVTWNKYKYLVFWNDWLKMSRVLNDNEMTKFLNHQGLNSRYVLFP